MARNKRTVRVVEFEASDGDALKNALQQAFDEGYDWLGVVPGPTSCVVLVREEPEAETPQQRPASVHSAADKRLPRTPTSTR